MSMKIEMGIRPEDGVTKEQPFAEGTGESQCFRIPAMICLNNGTLVAAADARWNHTGDACALDTIVSRSCDEGKTWHYTYANYLGDYGNKMSAYATAFIDPILASDGETVYMLTDLYPGGYGLNTAPLVPQKGTGFIEEGYLKLKKKGEKEYNYFLKDGKIYSVNNEKIEAEEYTVDAYFNLIDAEGNMDGNVFFHAPEQEDCPEYQVYPTMYLYLTKSKDGGASWSEPKLLNLKKEEERFYGAGPGRGLVTKSGRILFPCYNYENGVEYSSVIYSDDDGETWKRSVDMKENSSEAAITEADGTLYLFTRQKYDTKRGYYISKDYGETWSDRKEIVGITFDHSCQMSVITYSKKIDGKPVLLLSAAGDYRRQNGRIFVGLVQEDESIEWRYTHNVNQGEYSYSCIAELSDGKVGLIYECAESKGRIHYEIL